MKQGEITGKIAIGLKAECAAEHPADVAAMSCVSEPLFDFMELVTIERVRQHVIYGHELHKSPFELVSKLAEECGEVASAVNDYVGGEVGAFENLQVELVQVAATAAAFWEQTWEAAGLMTAAGIQLPENVERAAAMRSEIAGVAPLTAGVDPDTKPILAFTGGRGAGKDSVAKHIIDRYRFQKGSFAAPLKRLVAAEYGWDLAKLEELDYKEEFVPEIGMTRREMLILVGTTWFRSIDALHWIKRSAPDFRAALDAPGCFGLCVTDLRFQNEIDELRKMFPKNPVIVVRVVRNDSDLAPNADDAINAWRTIPADATWAASFGQLPLLYAQADQFMQVFETQGVAQ